MRMVNLLLIRNLNFRVVVPFVWILFEIRFLSCVAYSLDGSGLCFIAAQ